MNCPVWPGAIVPVSQNPVDEVAVCGTESLFFQITVVPVVIINGFGLKAFAPIPTAFSGMVTVTLLLTFCGAAFVTAGGATGAGFVLSSPHELMPRIVATATREAIAI